MHENEMCAYFRMEVRKLKGIEQAYFRDTWVEIDLDCIYENISNIKGLLEPNMDIYAVVKANAYGHGYEQVARTAVEAGATRLAVAFLDEAILLRKKGFTVPILVLGATRPEDANTAIEYDITLTVFHAEWLQAVPALSGTLKIHLKLDTGMGRLGIREKAELIAFAEQLNNNEKIYLDGVYTHFATADELDDTYVNKQIHQLQTMLQWCEELALHPNSIHSANTAASIRRLVKGMNGVRLGIGIYGLTPSIEMTSEIPFPLKAAFSLHSRLTNVKQLEKGDCISYGATYCATNQVWVGTVPIGYADGWTRRLQGFHVLVDGEKLPIIGRICMDQFMLKLSDRKKIGTEVVLIGEQNGNGICAEEVADYLGTINYEIVCMIGARVPRVYKRYGKVIEIRNNLLG